MEPVKNTQATFVDLLDRILDKGLVINADIIISVAGIPLIGVTLRAALAGMETMLKYGVMQPWDEKIRAWEKEHIKRQEISLLEGEEVKSKLFGSYYYSKGIYTAWRSGHIYLTTERLLLWNREFDEIIFQISLKKIKAIFTNQEDHFTEDKKEVLYLINQENRAFRLHAVETNRLKVAIEQSLKAMEHSLEENQVISDFEKESLGFLGEGEKVVSRGKMWHLMKGDGILGNSWKFGSLCLSNKRLYWLYDFEHKIAFQIPIEEISASVKERRDFSSGLKKRDVLDVIYKDNGTKAVASFSGKEIDEWEKVLNRFMVKGKQIEQEEKETCPQCGNHAPAKELLEKGCSGCGWVSPRHRKKLVIRNQ